MVIKKALTSEWGSAARNGILGQSLSRIRMILPDLLPETSNTGPGAACSLARAVASPKDINREYSPSCRKHTLFQLILKGGATNSCIMCVLQVRLQTLLSNKFHIRNMHARNLGSSDAGQFFKLLMQKAV